MLQIGNSESKNTPMGQMHTGEYTWYQERTVIFSRNKKRRDEDTEYEKEEITKEM
jgi:hypothetical protein